MLYAGSKTQQTPLVGESVMKLYTLLIDLKSLVLLTRRPKLVENVAPFSRSERDVIWFEMKLNLPLAISPDLQLMFFPIIHFAA